MSAWVACATMWDSIESDPIFVVLALKSAHSNRLVQGTVRF